MLIPSQYPRYPSLFPQDSHDLLQFIIAVVCLFYYRTWFKETDTVCLPLGICGCLGPGSVWVWGGNHSCCFLYCYPFCFCQVMFHWASHVALVVKNLAANAGDLRDAGSIPGEAGGLQSIGSQRVGHNWRDLARTLDSRLQCSLFEYAIHLFTLFIY